MILVDSSVWIDYFTGLDSRQTQKLDALLQTELLVTGDLILTEVLRGFDSERHFSDARRLLTSLSVIEISNEHIAIEAARNFRYLRAHGVRVRKTIDTLIATRCIESDYELLHSDKDFNPFTKYFGLRVA